MPSRAPLAFLVPVFGGLVAATVALMVLGTLVRAHGAGLACPDWPLCFGQVIPSFDMRIALEWGHRVFASCVSLGLAGATWLVIRTPGAWARVGRPLLLAWALLALQVLLGGLTVLALLAPWTVTAHLVTATAFCVTLLWIARSLAHAAGAARPSAAPLGAALRGLIAVAATALVAQIVLGGLLSSHGAGLACAHFPTCDGQSLVPTLSGPVGLHVLHRLNGAGLFVWFLALVLLLRRDPGLARLSFAALHLVILQIGVGALNVVARLPVEVTALHSAIAAVLVLVTASLAHEALARPRATGSQAAGSARALEAG